MPNHGIQRLLALRAHSFARRIVPRRLPRQAVALDQRPHSGAHVRLQRAIQLLTLLDPWRPLNGLLRAAEEDEHEREEEEGSGESAAPGGRRWQIGRMMWLSSVHDIAPLKGVHDEPDSRRPSQQSPTRGTGITHVGDCAESLAARSATRLASPARGRPHGWRSRRAPDSKRKERGRRGSREAVATGNAATSMVVLLRPAPAIPRGAGARFLHRAPPRARRGRAASAWKQPPPSRSPRSPTTAQPRPRTRLAPAPTGSMRPSQASSADRPLASEPSRTVRVRGRVRGRGQRVGARGSGFRGRGLGQEVEARGPRDSAVRGSSST